jgi:hypothetical protein
MNELLVDILENIISTMSNNVNTNMLSSILNRLNDTVTNQEVSLKQNELYHNNINTLFDGLKNDLTNVKDLVNKVSNDVSTSITLKLHDIKQSYINDLKDILHKNDNDICTKINPILEKHTSHIIDKTNLLFSNILSNSHDDYKKIIDNTLSQFQNSIKLDNYQLLTDLLNKNNNIDTRIYDFIKSIDTKFNELSHNIQNPITQYINSSEERINSRINSINDISICMNNKHDKLSDNIIDFINKFRTSSNKGQFGEGLLFNILSQLYPTADILDTTTDASNRGDFIINRPDKLTLLIENKDHSRNVSLDEVNKFIRDTNKHKLNGIFFSQKSGIISKPNWYIEVFNSNIRLYVHNVNYNSDIIKMSIDIIDTLSYHINNNSNININNNNNDCSISNDILDIINNEVKDFIDKRYSLINLLNEQHNILINKCNELIISPTLISILDTKYNSISQIDPLLCKYCRSYKGKNHAGLSAHLRGCKLKKQELNL